MLIFDSESFCIPAEETEVAAVYRSSAPVCVGEVESLPSCEAYVCVVARDQQEHVFAALHLGEIKRNLIYAVEPSAGEPSPSESSLEKALAFVEAMGFSMDAVNLKYGKAMREVVLKSIPVLLPPESIERTRKERNAELLELDRLVAEASEETEGAEESDSDRQLESKRDREERKRAADAAARKLALEKSAEEKAAGVGELIGEVLLRVNASEIARSERAERKRLEGENALLGKRAEKQAGEVARLKERMKADRAESQRRIAELEEALRETGDALEKEKGRKGEWTRERKSLEKQIQTLEKALSEANPEENSGGASALARAEERILELEQEVSEAREIAEAERFELELLVREKAAALRRIEELEKGCGTARAVETSEPNPVDADLRKRLSEMEAAAEEAGKRLKIERAEKQRLEAETNLFEKRISEMEEALRKAEEREREGGDAFPKSDGIVDKRIAELQRALQREEGRTEILRLEVERLVAEKTASEKRFAEGEKAPRKVSPPRSVGTVASPPPVRRPPPKDAFFHVDWDLGVIEYDSPGDILEIHQSMNMVQLSMEGYHSQHCSAWIVALKRGESRKVHVVFGLSESGLNLIYAPAKPVRNNDDYKRALSEAVKFLEVVGYLPEKMPLGKSDRRGTLSNVPFLAGPGKKAQGF